MADDPLLLDRGADDEPRHVVQEHQRDVERVAQPDEARRLVRRVHVERAAEHHRLVRHDADRLRRRSAANAVTRFFAHSGFIQKHVAVVDDRGHDLAHVVRARGAVGHDVVQLLDPAVDGIGAATRAAARRCAREEREVPAHGREALASSATSRSATPEILVCTRAAHLVLGHVLADRGLHEVPAAERHRRRPLHHRDEVGQPGDVRGPAAQCPSIAATIGTTPLIATCSRNRSPAPANDDRSSPGCARRPSRAARPSACAADRVRTQALDLAPRRPRPSSRPSREVVGGADSRRPWTSPSPVTTPVSRRRPAVRSTPPGHGVSGCCRTNRNSTNVPSSNSRSMRSRAVGFLQAVLPSSLTLGAAHGSRRQSQRS